MSRGVYVLDPGAEEYPGSPFDVLVPTDGAELLVDAPAAPIALLVGSAFPAEAVTAEVEGLGTVAVAAPQSEARRVAERLDGPSLVEAVRELAATTAPFAWAGPVAPGVTAVVELDGDALSARLRGGDADALADRVRAQADAGLPGSPGKRWSDVLDDVEVAVEDDAVVVSARTVALPPVLLRTLLDRASGATGR